MPQMDVVIIINEVIWLGVGLGIVYRGVEEGIRSKYKSMRIVGEEERGRREVKEEEVLVRRRGRLESRKSKECRELW